MTNMRDQTMRAWLALFLGIALAFVLWGLFYIEIAQDNRETLNLVLGALLAKLTDVYGYSFGSSAENTKLSHVVAKQADTANIIASAVPIPDSAVQVLDPGQTVKAPDPTPTQDQMEER
jgi:uncharacterized membrane protein